jgi:hypothetical protein
LLRPASQRVELPALQASLLSAGAIGHHKQWGWGLWWLEEVSVVVLVGPCDVDSHQMNIRANLTAETATMVALLGWLALALVFSLVSANPDPPHLADVDCLAAALAVKVVCSHHFSHAAACSNVSCWLINVIQLHRVSLPRHA